MEGTYNKYLIKLAEKCKVDGNFLSKVQNLLDKLVEFGYISRRDKLKLSKRLLNNLDTIIISSNEAIDFKSGYYDATKKELYIKDLSNTQAVYLRLIYALTSKEVGDKVFRTGYSTAIQSEDSFKIKHTNFALNRAVISNLVCRLLYTLPTTLSIVPTYRTYENNFLGFKIMADNDIYFLEGKILRQICYVTGINEEKLYNNLFSINPSKEISKIFEAIENTNLLSDFDKLSRTYSNYNKLCYYNNLISNNYIEIKKSSGTPNCANALAKKKEIDLSLKKIMQKMFPELDSEDEEGILSVNLEGSLAEKIGDLEDDIIDYISSIQMVLADTLLNMKNKFSAVGYVTKLLNFQDLLVIKNINIKKAIHDSIEEDLIHVNEFSCTNFIEKIKYSLALSGLAPHGKFKLFDDTTFFKILNKDNDLSTSTIAIKNLNYLEIANITDLDKDTNSIENNVKVLKMQSVSHLFNTTSSSDDLESIITNIREYGNGYKNVDINNFFLAKDDTHTYVIVNNISKPAIFSVTGMLEVSLVNLSEEYIILGETNSLPAVYKEKRMFNFIRNLPIFQKSSQKNYT